MGAVRVRVKGPGILGLVRSGRKYLFWFSFFAGPFPPPLPFPLLFPFSVALPFRTFIRTGEYPFSGAILFFMPLLTRLGLALVLGFLLAVVLTEYGLFAYNP